MFGFSKAAQRPSPVLPERPLPQAVILQIIVALIPVLGPHVSHLPPWCVALAATVLLWRAWLAWRHEGLPRRWILLLLVVLAVAATFYTHRTIFGRDPGVTLLTVLMSLKLMETRAKRDASLVVYLAYFLILTNFFYSQSISTAAMMLVGLMGITMTLINLNRDAAPLPLKQQAKLAGVMLGLSFPMMLVLFVLFPRVQGPLWGMPADANAGQTGLSDSMAPGTISKLSLSDGTAFRVKFDGDEPPPAQRYWRGPVLTVYDGRNWRGLPPDPTRRLQIESFGRIYNHTVTLEPHGKNWLFALEHPSTLPESSQVVSRLLSDGQFVTSRPVEKRLRYTVSSRPDFIAQAEEDPRDLQPALRIPLRLNPRARELVRAWQREGAVDGEMVNRALRHFRQEEFVYTLEPPLLGDNAVDEFLFQTKRGFCEHYAGTFVVLMRMAGIPARVVTGYQGGETNPVDGFVTVYQADAHAWSEVWLKGRGWVRVDPTAAVSPLRVEANGTNLSLPQRAAASGGLIQIDAEWARQLRYNFQAIQNSWNQWVLAYNPERQRDAMERFGFESTSWETMARALVTSMGILLALACLVLFVRRETPDPLDAAFATLTRKLVRRTDASLARASHEGPLDFLARVQQQFHAQKATPRAIPPATIGAVERLIRRYAALRYGKTSSSDEIKRFRDDIKGLSI